MDGVFGGFTRWAVVFLIIFVLFFLLIPEATPVTVCAPAGVGVGVAGGVGPAGYGMGGYGAGGYPGYYGY